MGKLGSWLQSWFGLPAGDRSGPDKSTETAAEKAGEFTILRVQPTPNPDAFQFVMNAPVITSGVKTFESAEDARGDAFAESVFQIFGVESLFVKENFVTVTKSSVVGWHTVFEKISQTIEKKLEFYTSPDDPDKDSEAPEEEDILDQFHKEDFPNCTQEEKTRIIEAVLDKAIRPALANDGGGLDVLAVEGNVVKIHYQGACGSCPSSTAGTLQYIETFLKDSLHPDLQVQAN